MDIEDMITVGSLVQAKQSMLRSYHTDRLQRIVKERIPLIVTDVRPGVCWVLFESAVYPMQLEDLFIISTPTPLDRD
jgi:hypothetical protein